MPKTSIMTTPVENALHPQALISVEGIQPGMVLAKPVYDAAERLLAATGTRLTLRHQRQMRQRGVTMVAVTVKDALAIHSAAPTANELSSVAVELVERAQNDPFMRELTLLARARHERRHQLSASAQEGQR